MLLALVQTFFTIHPWKLAFWYVIIRNVAPWRTKSFLSTLLRKLHEKTQRAIWKRYILKRLYLHILMLLKFRTVASLEQIANYNYNLNISLYANALNNENNFNVLSVSETLSNWKSVHAEMTSSITEMFTLIGKWVWN